MKILIFSLIALVFVTFALPVSAAGSCLPVNGGGKTDQKICATAAPINQAKPTAKPTTKPLPQRTTGGQTIYPANNNKSTPNTGPEEWSYIMLVVMAGAGVYLLKKTQTNI